MPGDGPSRSGWRSSTGQDLAGRNQRELRARRCPVGRDHDCRDWSCRGPGRSRGRRCCTTRRNSRESWPAPGRRGSCGRCRSGHLAARRCRRSVPGCRTRSRNLGARGVELVDGRAAAGVEHAGVEHVALPSAGPVAETGDAAEVGQRVSGIDARVGLERLLDLPAQAGVERQRRLPAPRILHETPISSWCSAVRPTPR